MASKVMLASNPNRSGGIDRVIVIGKSSDPDRVIVLSVDALSRDRNLLKRFNPSYYRATTFWDVIGTLIMIAGIPLSFVWHWWAFLVGFGVAAILHRSNQKSIADFAYEVLASNPDSVRFFASLGLVWE